MRIFLGREYKKQILKDIDKIYEALCAEDMSGAFRSAYILKKIDDIRWIIDPKGKGKERYERHSTKLQDSK